MVISKENWDFEQSLWRIGDEFPFSLHVGHADSKRFHKATFYAVVNRGQEVSRENFSTDSMKINGIKVGISYFF